MSDNFSPNATTSAAAYVFAADEVGVDQAGKPVLVPRVKVQHGPDGQAADVSSSAPLPVRDALGATAAGQDAALAVLQQIATSAGQAAALAVLQQILAKLIAAPATAQGQSDQLAALATLVGQTDGIEGSLTSILAKLSADPATAAAQAAELVKLTSMDAKMPALVGGLAPIRLGGSAIALDLVADSAGNLFSPGASAHAYGYDGSGNLTTDTATLAGVTRVKTYAWTSGRMTAESQWVVQ